MFGNPNNFDGFFILTERDPRKNTENRDHEYYSTLGMRSGNKISTFWKAIDKAPQIYQ